MVGNEIARLKEIGMKFSSRSFTSATPLQQCGIYRYGFTVENNGDVYVCPDAREGFDPIGNVRKISISKLYDYRKNKFPLNSNSYYCFVKKLKNPEESENRSYHEQS